MKLIFLKIPLLLLLLIGFFLLFLYYAQEKLIFFPSKLSKEHRFTFKTEFEEHFIPSGSEQLHSLLFTKPESKGIILYFHGNAGNLDSWGRIHEYFQDLPYDVWIIDYRGYGKSSGGISSEMDLHIDADAFYQMAMERYEDVDVIIYGPSIGSGVAAYLAEKHPPKMLILETPYFNFPDLVQSIYPQVPRFLLRYKLQTNEYIANTNYPIHLFHGTEDGLIPYDSSLRLAELSDNCILHTIKGAGHNNIGAFPDYQQELKVIFK